jgi:hypothetical protein
MEQWKQVFNAAFDRAAKQTEVRHDSTTISDFYRSSISRGGGKSSDGFRDYGPRVNRGSRR